MAHSPAAAIRWFLRPTVRFHALNAPASIIDPSDTTFVGEWSNRLSNGFVSRT